MILDLGTRQDHAPLYTHAVANCNAGADCDVGANLAVLANLGGGVDHHVTAVHEGLSDGCECLGALAGQRRQVQAGSREEVLGLADIHPEALEIERVQLAVTNHLGEGLLLDGGGAQLNALQDRGVQDVETSVDAVADELDRLLDETINAGRVVGLVHDDTVVGGLLDLGDDNGALIAVSLVEFGQLFERVFAGDVGVEDEERAIILAQDLSGELEGTGGAQGLRLDRERDLDAKLFLVLVATHKSAHVS